jgi:hypothetical protein
MCDRCAVRVREEWGLPALPQIAPEPRRWRPAFPYVTVGLAASIAGVAFAIIVGPPNNASGPPRVISRAPAPAVEVAQPPSASPPSVQKPIDSRVATAPAPPSSETLADEEASAAERARMVAARSGTRAGSRPGIVRAKDRRAVGTVERAAALDREPVAAPEPVVPASEPFDDSPIRLASGAPALIEVQAP